MTALSCCWLTEFACKVGGELRIHLAGPGNEGPEGVDWADEFPPCVGFREKARSGGNAAASEVFPEFEFCDHYIGVAHPAYAD